MREKTKYRLSVPLSTHIYDQVVLQAQAFGVSPSSYVAFIVGSHLTTSNKLITGLNETITKQIEQQRKGKENE